MATPVLSPRVITVQESGLQAWEETLGPKLGSLTGQNIPAQQWASVCLLNKGTWVSGVPEAVGNLGLSISKNVQDCGSYELLGLGPKHSRVHPALESRSGNVSRMDSHHT